jgi:hypothetical protein
MAALVDLDFFEPELDDVLFPESLDADYPAPDSSWQWFPELPESAPMFAEQNAEAGVMTMPLIGQFADASLMPPTPESDGDEAMSYFSPMPMPHQQEALFAPLQTPESQPTYQMSPVSPSPSAHVAASVTGSPEGWSPLPPPMQPASILMPTISSIVAVADTGYVNPEASPSLPDLSWSPEPTDSPAEGTSRVYLSVVHPRTVHFTPMLA